MRKPDTLRPTSRSVCGGLTPRGVALLALALVAGGCYTAEDRSTSEWRPGGWRQAKVTVTEPRLPPARILAESRKAYDAGAYQDACEGYLTLKERYPDTAEGKDVSTSFHIGECYFRLGEGTWEAAHPHYMDVLKGNPGQEMLNTTLGRIYDIGIGFLYGRAKKSFLFFRYRSPSFGVDILTGDQGLATNYPFLPLSEEAIMEVAKHHFDQEEFAEAEPLYERISRDYPQSKWHPMAEYQLPLSIFRQIKGVDYDQTLMVKARSRFNAYVVHYPRGERVEAARAYLHTLAEWEAERDLRIAKYYLRESYPQAARLYLRSVFINNPNTAAEREARAIYDNLEKRRTGT